MSVKKMGVSSDLIFHPGETLGEVLIERGISQLDLATRAGVSAAYVSNVIAGKKDISANFAMGLEYALNIPKSFWLNLQANYEAELLEIKERDSITDTERAIHDQLSDVVSLLYELNKMAKQDSKDETILSLRRALKISNLENLKEVARVKNKDKHSEENVNLYILGARMRLQYLLEKE